MDMDDTSHFHKPTQHNANEQTGDKMFKQNQW